MDLENIRVEYINESFDLKDLKATPHEQLEFWMDQTLKAEITYPNAVSLCTIDQNGHPDSRVVLIKEILKEGIIFYTDYTGAKGTHLQTNKNVAITFFWKELDRQIRIQGRASKIDPEKSENYFLSRPFESKISALASNQSSPVEKTELERRVAELKNTYKDGEVPYPHNWGGYSVSYDKVEFWQGRPNRLHDRFQFSKNNEEWKVERLAP